MVLYSNSACICTMDSKYKPPPLVMNNVSNYQPAPAALAGQQQCINMVNNDCACLGAEMIFN